jgi:photosystem I subunit PsaN
MMATLARTNKAVSCRAQAQQQQAKPAAAATAGRRALVFGGLAAALAVVAPRGASASSLEDDLLARSQVNKALNDKKRLATSYANLARSR